MLFNGHTQESIDALDEATMNELIVMYADGLIGNNKLLVTLASLTAGVFNYIRPQNTPAYSLKTMIGSSYNYIFGESEVSSNDALLTFMTQAQGFDINKFTKE